MTLPTIWQLECLVSVAEKLNFRQAAEACFVSQPALSAQIKQLESLLGLKLFERDRRTVIPTPAGTAMVDKARVILADLRDLTEAATTFTEPLSSTLRLGVIPTVAPYLLPKGFSELHRRFPNLRLLLREAPTARLLEMLAEGSLDLLLLALNVELGDVEKLSLLSDPFVLAVPPGHALANRKRVNEKDLEGEEVLLLDDDHCLREQALAICQTARAGELGDFRASSLSTLVQMVSGGVGVTLLPEMALEVEASRNRQLGLIPFSANGPRRDIGLAWRPSSLRKKEFELFGEALVCGLK